MTREPRISVLKLAEYLEATPARREEIVRDQLKRTGFKARRHREARTAIKEFLEGGPFALRDLLDRMDRLQAAHPEGTWEVQERDNAVEAIRSFLRFREKIAIGDGTMKAKRRTVRHAGLWISMSPDLIVRRRQDLAIGSLKLNLTKSKLLSDTGGTIVADLLHLHASSLFSGTQYRADASLCQVVDVFAQRVFRPSDDPAAALEGLVAWCDDICRTWRRLEEQIVDVGLPLPASPS